MCQLEFLNEFLNKVFMDSSEFAEAELTRSKLTSFCSWHGEPTLYCELASLASLLVECQYLNDQSLSTLEATWEH